ncbi:MAG: hypothetical protein AB2825_12155 [Candidatus Thiodiazotropha endolucinida]
MSKPAVILLVDDSRMDVELTLDAFKEARLSNRIEVSYSGQEALDYLFGNNTLARIRNVIDNVRVNNAFSF